jgi:2-polyprenyl-3-methyl-5-hydroxy-6-metoxy-1,4-benzoquinol methylase
MSLLDTALVSSGNSPPTTVSLTEISSEWDQNVAERATELENGIDQTFYEITLPLFSGLLDQYSPGCEVVDVGCGLGYLSKHIIERDFNVQGIDVSHRSIEYASGRFPEIDFVEASIEEFAHEHAGSFDVCIANMVLQNTIDLRADLRAIHSMLKENGILLASIPHPCFWFQTRQFAPEYEFCYLDQRFYKIPFKIRNGRIHPSRTTYFHRPLSTYLLALWESGFRITRFVEPKNTRSCPAVDLLFWCAVRS